MKKNRGVVKGGNEGLIGFEQSKDEALPVSKGPLYLCGVQYSQRLPQSVKQLKSVERSIVGGRLASGNCFITPFESSSHLL